MSGCRRRGRGRDLGIGSYAQRQLDSVLLGLFSFVEGLWIVLMGLLGIGNEGWRIGISWLAVGFDAARRGGAETEERLVVGRFAAGESFPSRAVGRTFDALIDSLAVYDMGPQVFLDAIGVFVGIYPI
jgi:hypothetical protein